MTTKVYGCSDDLIEFEGDVKGEASHYSSDNEPAMVIFSDGTIIEVEYGKADLAIWSISTIKTGDLFDRIDVCEDEDATPYSDVIHFRDGLKFAYVATEYQRVK